MPKPCCHGYHYSYSAEYQPQEKKWISLICLRPPYLQVCLSRCLHLLACVTSCLSHYLPVCISVCPPASAALLRPQRDVIFLFKGENRGNNCLFAPFASLSAWILYATIQYNTIYYPRGMFYIPSISFLTSFSLTLFFPSPQLCSPFTGRQESWLKAAVPLPKPTASKDERPPLIALPGLLLSKQSTSLPLRKYVQCTLQPCQLHSHTPRRWWKYFGVCSKYSSAPHLWFCVWIQTVFCSPRVRSPLFFCAFLLHTSQTKEYMLHFDFKSFCLSCLCRVCLAKFMFINACFYMRLLGYALIACIQ